MNERRYCIIEAVADNCSGLWMGLWITSWFDLGLFLLSGASLCIFCHLRDFRLRTKDLSKDIVTTVTRV